MGKNRKNQVIGKSPDELLKRAYELDENDDARDLYRDWAQTYDGHLQGDLGYTLPSTVAQHFADVIIDRSARVLDIGCGTGLTGLSLAAHGFTCIDGLDFSPEMLSEARKKGFYGALIEADLTKPLDLTSASYVGAISTGTFTEGHVDAEAFDEIFRLLNSGGHFITSINSEIWEEGGFGLKIETLEATGVMRVVEKVSARAFTDGEETFWIMVMRKG